MSGDDDDMSQLISDIFADIDKSIQNVPQTLSKKDKRKLDESIPEHIRKENAYIENDLCYANDPNVIDWFLQNDYDIDGWGISGHTPLHYHLLRNDLDAVKHLIEKGANISKPNIYGEYPIDQAFHYAGIDMFNLLDSHLQSQRNNKNTEQK